MKRIILLLAALLPLPAMASTPLPPLVSDVGLKALVKICDVTYERHILGRPDTRQRLETRYQSMRVYDFTDRIWFEDGSLSVASGELSPQMDAVSVYRAPNEELMVRGRGGDNYVYSQVATRSVRLHLDNCIVERTPHHHKA